MSRNLSASFSRQSDLIDREQHGFVVAAGKGDIAALEAFLLNHPNALDTPSHLFYVSRTALANAILGGQVETVKWLLNRGASLETRNDRGWTPLTILGQQIKLQETLPDPAKESHYKNLLQIRTILQQKKNTPTINPRKKNTP